MLNFLVFEETLEFNHLTLYNYFMSICIVSIYTFTMSVYQFHLNIMRNDTLVFSK